MKKGVFRHINLKNLELKEHKRLFVRVILLFVAFSFVNCEREKVKLNGTVTDINGNIYNTVKIGSQEWMAENLKSTKYQNGEDIGTTDPNEPEISEEIEEKYQWPNNGDESNVEIYGRLYTWHVATDTRNVCPIGWHVPTEEDWEVLVEYLGGWEVAGGKLKEEGITHWQEPNQYADNRIGFTALPSGWRILSGIYAFNGILGDWWSSTEKSETEARSRYVFHDDSYLLTGRPHKNIGLSIRCVKD